ncbi:MAG: S8 family serine peptidase [Pseudomonadota bacterium]
MDVLKMFPRTLMASLLLLLGQVTAFAGAVEPHQPQNDGDGRMLITIVDPHHNQRVAIPGETGAYAVRRGYEPSALVQRRLRGIARRHALQIIDGWQMASLGVYCALVEAKAEPVRTRQQVLQALRADRQVESAQPLNAFDVRGTMAPDDPYAALQAAHTAMAIDKAHRWATGKGVRVAVIDTGIDARHRDLRKRIRESRNFVPGEHAAEVHGTAVAGVIGAIAGNGLGGYGVAPDVALFAYRACWDAPGSAGSVGRCDSFTLARALDRAIDKSVDVVNLSLAGPADPLLTRLVDEALAKGIVVVGPQVADTRAQFPTAIDGVIAVTSAPVDGAISAPGADVLTTVPRDAFDFMQGVSFATAHVSGVVALIRERQPDASPGAVYEALRSSADTVPAGAVVNACRALDSIAGTSCE